MNYKEQAEIFKTTFDLNMNLWLFLLPTTKYQVAGTRKHPYVRP